MGDIRHRNKGRRPKQIFLQRKQIDEIKLTMQIHLIVAGCGESLGIGQEGRLPWRLPQEIKHFAKLTTQQNGTNAVVMGRKTWESIPPKFRPLKNRVNVVLTRNADFSADGSDVKICKSLSESQEKLAGMVDVVWIIGGASVYAEALPMADRVYLTHIHQEFPCDVNFPRKLTELLEDFVKTCDPLVSEETQKEGDVSYDYLVLEKKTE